ncbi:FAD-dependent oxidoreductase [Paenarthrobacter ilicis]|uniref:NAD(P)/FAD-dependent oxidoreductase n=1 Tax=Paenarthrobacter ilicis TaxID=43665 RepID=UPI0028D43180|nr:FAD-dependent oxidoreductase [Paenarthrobacter ilicis]
MLHNTTGIAIIGGSTAALRAAEAANRRAPGLKVTVISSEDHLPYELPPLSKIPLSDTMDIESLIYPSARALQEQGVEFRLGHRATALDPRRRVVSTDHGDLTYRAAVIATGCEPILPRVFRGEEDVFVLRRFEDSLALRHSLADRRRSVAIVGAGFIGGELASTLVGDGRAVSLIDLSEHPLIRFGEAVSTVYEDLHRVKGVDTYFGVGAVGTVERSGRRFLTLSDGHEVPADVIVVGVGVRPAVSWLSSSGIELENGILTDRYLQSCQGVFAAGDAVRWPNSRFNATMRIEHWTTAAEQGRAAGLNAVSFIEKADLAPFASVPFFWSDQHGQRVQWAGYQTAGQPVLSCRSDDGSMFFFREGDFLSGVLAFERRQEFVQLRAKLRHPVSWDSLPGLVEGLEPVIGTVPVP